MCGRDLQPSLRAVKTQQPSRYQNSQPTDLAGLLLEDLNNPLEGSRVPALLLEADHEHLGCPAARPAHDLAAAGALRLLAIAEVV